MQEDKTGILLKAGTNEVEFIELFIGSVCYGINVSKVQQVFAKAVVQITDVPEKPHGVLGVMYFRKDPILLVDLRQALGVQEPLADNLKDRQMVVVTRFNKTTTGFLIDGVSKIHRTSWNNFEPMGFEFVTVASNYVVGTIRIEERVVLILDLERLLADITPSKASDTETHATDIERARRSKIRILYAEDSKMVQKMTVKTLAGAGFENVTTFDNGATAFEYIRNLQEKAIKEGKSVRDYVDLIITDIEMPKMDGLTLCKNLKQSGGPQHIPSVVVYSSMINEEMARKCQSVGADAQLSKPHGTEIIEIADRLCGISA